MPDFGYLSVGQLTTGLARENPCGRGKIGIEMAPDIRAEDMLYTEELPVLPWVDIAAEVLFASDAATVHSPWVDAFVPRPGSVVLVLGDVAGCADPSPVVATQVRAALKERLLTGAGVEDTLIALDRFTGHLPEGSACSLCLLELNSSDEVMSVGSAGHPLPAVVTDTRVESLGSSGSTVLGFGGPYVVRSVGLRASDLLLGGHNGAFSGRPEEWREGINAWYGLVIDGWSHQAPDARSAARACRLGVEAMGSASGFREPVVTLAAHRITPLKPLRIVRLGDRRTIGLVLDRLSAWLMSGGVGLVDRIAALTTAEELVRNVAEHAYPRGVAGRLGFDARVADDGILRLRVVDQGAWTRPDPFARGGGLGTAAALADHFSVRHESGTVAEWHRRLGRPIVLRRAREPLPLATQPTFGVAVSQRVDRVVLDATGALDDLAAEDLFLHLMRLSKGGIVPTTLDVSGVTRWSGAGVQLMLRLTGRTGHGGPDGRIVLIDLVAAPGTVAEQVLDILQVPHRTAEPQLGTGAL